MGAFGNTLTTIGLSHERLSFKNLQILSGLLAKDPPVLKTASFSLRLLFPAEVDLLANKLQGLQDLTLLFSSFESGADIADVSNGDDAEVRITQRLPCG